jgi:WD40 repeat protein
MVATQAQRQPALAGGTLNTVTAVACSDGSEIYVASSDQVRVYSSLTGDRIAQLTGHAAEVTAIALDPDDEQQVGRINAAVAV